LIDPESQKYDGVFYSEKTGLSESGKKVMDMWSDILKEAGMTRWWFRKMKILRLWNKLKNGFK